MCKHLAYDDVPATRAEALDHCNQEVLSPYLNYHRPGLFVREHVYAKGKVRKTSPAENVATPCEKLKPHPNDGTSFETQDAQAYQMSDNEAARLSDEAKVSLFQAIGPAHNLAA